MKEEMQDINVMRIQSYVNIKKIKKCFAANGYGFSSFISIAFTFLINY
jgi:hypothetical protein